MLNVKISGFADEISNDFNVQINATKEMGMQYICLRNIDGYNIADYNYYAFRDYVVPKLQNANIQVSSLGSPLGKIKYNDEDAFEEQCIKLHDLCLKAKLCNTKHIRIFSFYVPAKRSMVMMKSVIHKLKVFRSIAQIYDVTLLLEHERGLYGENAKQLEELMQELSSRNFKCILDFGNFIQVQQAPYEAYARLKDYIGYIHIKDMAFDEPGFVVCGCGDGQIKEVLCELLKDGYEGFLTIEPQMVDVHPFEDSYSEIQSLKRRQQYNAYYMQYQALCNTLASIQIENKM